ncbi:MAG TPA: hypothetical protein VGA08_03230 [Candidatus Saccharimonadales bacterium]
MSDEAQPADETNQLEGTDDKQDELKVKEGAIDPTAEKALKDLFKGSKEDNSVLKQVKVYSPFRIYYDNKAASVSALNGTGPFDILPGHKKFLTLLSSGDIVVRSTSGKEETITIDRGVMHVSQDIVRVFLDV